MERVELTCVACHRPIGRDLTFDQYGHPWHDQCHRERWHPDGPLRAPTRIERGLWQIPLAVRILIAVVIFILIAAFLVGFVQGFRGA